MSFIWNLFFSKKKDEDDFESILEALSSDIKKRQISLAEIRTRERRATLSTTLYTLAVWLVYVAVWYAGLIKWTSAYQKALKAAPVIIGPIVIMFTRRIVQIWYASKGDKEEKTLRELMKQQRVKVDEIKKKTNYNRTRDLLSRYDEMNSGAPGTPESAKQRLQQQNPPLPNQSVFSTPQQPQQQRRQPGTPQQFPTLPSSPPPPSGPIRKSWFDKVADAVLGGEDDVARYALICEKCFAHNGLVKENALEETQYVCPKCQHMNPARKPRAGGQKVLQPRPISISTPTPPATPGSSSASALRQRQMSMRSPRARGSDESMMQVDEDSDS